MTIVYVLGAILVGWVIGFVDSNLRTAKKIRAAEAEAAATIAATEQKLALASQAPQIVKDNPGLLRLKNESGRIVLELDGEPVERALSPERKKRLIELITIFRPWLDTGQPSQTASRPMPPPQAQPMMTPVSEPISRPIQPAAAAPKKPELEKNLASLSIVQQIDSVLQARIVDTPLAKQGVRLQESLQGDVEVYVGLKKFHSVEDVPDEAVRSTIRAAIAEWEEKYTPGAAK